MGSIHFNPSGHEYQKLHQTKCKIYFIKILANHGLFMYLGVRCFLRMRKMGLYSPSVEFSHDIAFGILRFDREFFHIGRSGHFSHPYSGCAVMHADRNAACYFEYLL